MVVWGPLTTEPPCISARTLHLLKAEFLGYMFAMMVWVYLLSNFHTELWKAHHLCSRVQYGRSRSSKVDDLGTNWKGMQNFLLVINSNLGRTLHHLWDMATYWLNITNFPYPSLIYSPGSGWPLSNLWKPLKILILVFPEAESEDFMILACIVLIGQQGVTSIKTDGWTLLR